MSLLVPIVLAALIQSAAAPAGVTIAGKAVEEGKGTPIAGAVVTAMLMPSRQPAAGPWAVDRPLMATTDREGRYQLDGLQPGRYRLNVEKAGFARQLESAPIVDAAGGERIAVDVSLQRGAVIVGRVLDETGEPLADARVMAFAKLDSPRAGARAGDALWRPVGLNVQTNDIGEFRLFGLPGGDYYVQAMPRTEDNATGLTAGTLLPTFFPDATDGAAAGAIRLDAGQTSDEILIRMASAPAYRVSGIVVDEDGKPVGNAIVRLTSEDADKQMPMFMMPPWKQARTDRSGQFSIASVTSGTYTLLAVAPRMTSQQAPGNRMEWGASAAGFGGVISGTVSGSIASERVMTETGNGTTFEWRDGNGTKVAIAVDQSSVTNLQVTVKKPASQY